MVSERQKKFRIGRLVKALRGEILRENGEPYRKATGKLRRGNSFCCLGVACDLYRRSREGKGKWVDGSFMGADSYLPQEVMDFYGFLEPSPLVEKSVYGEIESAIYLNDNGRSFKEIAECFQRMIENPTH